METSSVRRHGGRTYVTITRHPGFIGKLFGRKSVEHTAWTHHGIYWFRLDGSELGIFDNPDEFDFARAQREYEARVKLFGETLA